MPRHSTPSFVVELPLRLAPGDARRLDDRAECGRRLFNTLLQEGLRSIKAMRQDPSWSAVRLRPVKERAALYEALRRAHGFSKTQFDARALAHLKAAGFAGRIGSHEAQRLAERVFAALNRWICGRGGRPRFKGRRRPLHSLEGKNNATMLQWKTETKTLQVQAGWQIAAVLPRLDRDEWLWTALEARTKYCRLLWRQVKGERRWFVQLVQEGAAPMKASVLARLAEEGTIGGLDFGPSAVAWVTDDEAGVFRFAAEVDRPHALIRRLQRQIDRQRRANNPANFDEQGRCRQGMRHWAVSARQQRTEQALAEAQRHEAQVRRHAHGRDTNFLLSKARAWKDDGVSPRALQQRYGRSISVRAPGHFMTQLQRKAERAGGARIVIDIRALKTSQYDHSTDTFTKKPLSQRQHVFGDGRGRVHRDVYSAFLARHAEGSTHQPPNLEKAWEELASTLLVAGWYVDDKPQDKALVAAHGTAASAVREVRPKVLSPAV